MALTIHLRSVGAFCVFVQLSLFASAYEYHKPQILSEYETIIEAGDNYTVLCQGNTPLDWSWPEVQGNYTEWTEIKVIDDKPKDNIYKYGSRLFVQNATYVYTGFYSCFGRDTGSDDDVAQVYLYVRDDEHLSVKTEEVESLLATQYSDVVLPCRPTSPDVKVDLTLITGENVFLDVIYEDGGLYRYHPHYGFITNRTRLPEQDLYYCTFTRDSNSHQITIIVDVEQK